jgi:hypothetical protein
MIPRFVVNLKDPPSTRWNSVIASYKKSIKNMESIIDNLLSVVPCSSIILSLVSLLRNYVYYNEELQSFSDQCDVPLNKLIVMQLMYEANACCTSIIVNDEKTNTPLHIRTMDWDMPYLKNLTIEVDFYYGTRFLFRTTTWAGYVGILTGMRNKKYSISVNFRSCNNGSLLTNLRKAIWDYSFPIGFLVREVLTKCRNYKSALSCLSHSKIIAPCYFILAGNKKNQQCIIIRDRDTPNKIIHNSVLIQTNADDEKGQNILWSHQRKQLASNILSKKSHTEKTLWKLIKQHPIKNDETIYTTLMQSSINRFVSLISLRSALKRNA